MIMSMEGQPLITNWLSSGRNENFHSECCGDQNYGVLRLFNMAPGGSDCLVIPVRITPEARRAKETEPS